MIKQFLKTTAIFVHLLLVGLSMVQAQQSTFDLPDYYPVSPNAASLGSFGLYPVNKNLGTTNVTIPIYTLQENGLTVPINLGYNTSGIKLNDLASWVGLGWSLNAGGAIVRNTKGLPDIGFNPTVPNIQNAEFNKDNYDYMLGAVKGLRDTAPDQYVINALDINASFYFDPDSGEAKFEDGSPIKVDAISANEMHITLGDGTLLIFGTTSDNMVATEVTKYSNRNYTFDYVSAWYLTELVSSDRRNSISFRYKSQTLVQGYAQPTGETVYVDPNIQANPPLRAAYQELSQIDRQTLESIIFENGHIDFESSFDRPDLEDDYKLDSIMVYFENGTNDRLVDQYHFTYGEFERHGGSFSRDYEVAPIFFDTPRQIKSRNSSLKLLTMYRGASPNDGQVHSFEYNSTQLPIRCTTAQDAWGHPNTNSGSLLPTTTTTIESEVQSVPYTYGNGDRSANETMMKAGMLEKITYPTGGYTTFDHEANRYLSTDQVYINKSINVRAFGEECNDPAYPNNDEATFTIPNGSKNIKLHISMSPISHQGSSASYLALDDKFYSRPSPNSSGGSIDSSDGWFTTIDLIFGQAMSLGTADSINPVLFRPGEHTIKAFDTGYGAFAAYDCSQMSLTISWQEPSGTQQIDKLIGGLRTKTISNYDGKSPVPTRVKRYEYADPNVIHPERNRGYIKRNVSSTSTSLFPTISISSSFNNNIGGEPAIEYGTVTEYEHDPVTGLDNGKVVSYYEQVPLARSLGSVIGPEVFRHPNFSWNYTYFQTNNILEDYWTEASQNLLLRALDGPDEYSFYETRAWKRGKLLREEIYKTDSGSDILIAKTENIYSTIESLNIRQNFVFSPFPSPHEGEWNIVDPYDQSNDSHSIQFAYRTENVELGRKVMSSSISTKYDDNGQNPVVTTTEYFYDNLVHKQPTRTKTTNSRGQVQEVTTAYPDDVLLNTSLGLPNLSNMDEQAINELTSHNQHRISQPIQTETILTNANGDQLSRTVSRTLFKDWDVDLGLNEDTDLVLPKGVRSLKGVYDATDNPMQDRVTHHGYDGNGNPVEVSLADGPHTYYVWGYGGTFPIAKLENFSAADATGIQTVIDAAVDASNADVDTATEETLRTELNDLRNAATNALVTTYTYDPLIGMTSMTDPRGYTVHYSYDNFNRLKEVRDADNNLVTDHQYHYRSQN